MRYETRDTYRGLAVIASDGLVCVFALQYLLAERLIFNNKAYTCIAILRVYSFERFAR